MMQTRVDGQHGTSWPGESNFEELSSQETSTEYSTGPVSMKFDSVRFVGLYKINWDLLVLQELF
jgi:hypothetical protein